ncbi:MAG TPA: SEL1-like repeat protein [Pseudolabrys sp.]|nr:SEL1-like repeat protein [Pseudolabrys sp.]
MAETERMPAFAGYEPANANACFDLGMKYSVGSTVPVDLIAAHKWFNIAAMRGNKDAIRLRREVATLMSDSEIGLAQRAARDWLKAHPQASAQAPAMSAAA